MSYNGCSVLCGVKANKNNVGKEVWSPHKSICQGIFESGVKGWQTMIFDFDIIDNSCFITKMLEIDHSKQAYISQNWRSKKFKLTFQIKLIKLIYIANL